MARAEELAWKTAGKLAGEAGEAAARRAGMGEESARAIGIFLSSTFELLEAARATDATASAVAVPLVEKNLKLLGLTRPEAAACAVALWDMIVDPARYRSLNLLGLPGSAAYGSILAYDVLKGYGECFIPLREQYLMQRAEAEVRLRLDRRGNGSGNGRRRLP